MGGLGDKGKGEGSSFMSILLFVRYRFCIY